RCSLEVFFGDGTSAVVNRSIRPGEDDTNLNLCSDPPMGNGMPLNLIGYPQYLYFKKNIYRVNHTYPGSGTYVISMKDPNRVAGICNITNSVNIQFYLQSVLVINDFLGCNQYSPQLSTVPLDMACVNHCFYHNPGAYDPEGDSLSYSLSPCYDTTQAPLAQWFPLPLTTGGSLSIDAVTGLMSWCSPPDICSYNICIRITKWRKWYGHWYNMGYVQRDMQILVSTCSNDNPILNEPKDTCVIAGALIHFTMTGTDPIHANGLHLSAYGDVFHVTTPVATFPVAPDPAVCSCYFGSNPISSAFNWQTTCDHIRSAPHQVTFRLENNDVSNPSQPVDLLDYESMNITVIAPAVQNLKAKAFGQTMHLSWNQEACNPAANPFLQYEIYRREGCDTNNPGPCITGVPAAWGYTLIGTTPVGQITTTTYIDNNGGSGLVPGVTYSYRVVALFSDGAESQPSKNACASLKQDIPVITNVDVDVTSTTAGVIFVKWKNALADTALGLDTVAYPGPYTLNIYRSQGYVLANPGTTPVRSLTSTFLYNLQDSIIDRIATLDTYDTAWSYRIDFYSAASVTVPIGSTQKASSVYLHIAPSDHKLTLTWKDTVPWTNYQYRIYKQSLTNPLLWNYLGTTSQRSFVDSNLINHHNYCYYVTTYGSYFNPALSDTLLNRSQRTCMEPFDNTPPCAPQLTLHSDCENFTNTLTWTDPNHSCADDVVTYNIWFAPNTTDPMTVIQTVTISSDTSYTFTDLPSVAGCYAVSALDSFAINQSVKSNIICADNCPFYALPNVFTPNGDNINDVYNALPYRYVESVDMNIYDRWGVLLYHTTDPHIHWDGKAIQTGSLCSDGVYYYICTVNSKRLSGTVPFILKGYIQLLASPDINH
ncbi:MAG TPA: gliding motility-associated C-terminal domain-containing protein, partial [Bacteroidia bacterium]|nr:gliding motility-associated C-terminal domain-containing protein [Bacteroidia bacterium]